MDHPLPTPPRSPAPSPIKIKQEIDDSFLNEDFPDPFDDIFGLMREEENSGRKRKLSELLGVEMDFFLRDFSSPTHSSPTSLPTPSLLDTLLHSLDTPTPPPTRPQSPAPLTGSSPSSGSSPCHSPLIKEEDFSDFLSTLATPLDYYDDFFPMETPTKRQKYFDENILNDDCFLFTEQEEIQSCSLEQSRVGLENDHNYCASEENILLDGLEVDKYLFGNMQKKTKILVPLKSLMKTLQQKSFLVSDLGLGKKVIRLTGAGESVKGVLQSTTGLISSYPTSTTPPNPTPTPSTSHNVRKRPHSNLLLTKLQKLEEEPQNPLSLPKKKTKAHNNMERMRRIDLRNSFDNLKKLVPVLSKSPKCSKVEILRRAEEYVRGLRVAEKRLGKEEGLLRVRMQELRGRLAME